MVQSIPAYHATQFYVVRSPTGFVLALGTDQLYTDDKGQMGAATSWFGSVSLPASAAKALLKALSLEIPEFEKQWGIIADMPLKGPPKEEGNVIFLGGEQAPVQPESGQ